MNKGQAIRIELEEPTGFHYNRNNDWLAEGDKLVMLEQLNEIFKEIPNTEVNNKDDEKYYSFTVNINDILFKLDEMKDVYQKVREGRIISVTLDGSVLNKIATQYSVADPVKLLNYCSYYNKNITELILWMFEVDVQLIIAIFKIKGLKKLTFEQCNIPTEILYLLFRCLIGKDRRIETFDSYLSNLRDNSAIKKNNNTVSKFFGFDYNYDCRIEELRFHKSIFKSDNSIYKNEKKGEEYNSNIIVEMLETNNYIRKLPFPGFNNIIHSSKYGKTLKNNYTLFDTNLFDSDVTMQRNKELLRLTKRCCLTLILIKKFGIKDSEESKQLAVLDINLVRIIARMVFVVLKNDREHLKLLATKY